MNPKGNAINLYGMKSFFFFDEIYRSYINATELMTIDNELESFTSYRFTVSFRANVTFVGSILDCRLHRDTSV
jgi:hypothetical protein